MERIFAFRLSQEREGPWPGGMPAAALWPGWSMAALRLHSNVSGSSTAAGIVVLAVDGGAGLGLPSPAAVPASALALESGLEASLLNKFMTSVMFERGEEKQTEKNNNPAAGTRCSGVR